MGFFQGIYGFDFLSILLLLLSSIFNFWRTTKIIGTILFLVVVYRTFSKDIYKRKSEDAKFRSWANKYLSKLGLSLPDNLPNMDLTNLSMMFNRLKYNINQRKKYKVVICPGCRKKLQLPRGRGKVIITCRACKTEFKAKV